ncbi:MAG TPA: hypothetical protein PK504_04550 [Ferruginibacter sp.]|nr:hypothetical protein [Ferruginibacter sp.]HRE62874.1 hypothetical protein [Ferruginibacter sp.]
MLEILILVFLVINVGNKARRKGLNVLRWRVLTVLAWIVAEMLGLFIGIMLVGKDDLVKLMMIGIVSAFGGYLLIKYNLDKHPDIDDDINNIGR